jgi:hypothetical protein
MRDLLTLTFNASEDGSGDQSSWSRIWVSRGGLAALIEGERLYHVPRTGGDDPVEEEGASLTDKRSLVWVEMDGPQ